MTTDKELLELAAKAAGIEIEPCTCSNKKWPFKIKNDFGIGHWNPLEDDGDALRLMVQLDFGIYRGYDSYRGEFTEVFYRPRKYARQKSCIEDHKDHTNAIEATRRAIGRAAAEIEKATP